MEKTYSLEEKYSLIKQEIKKVNSKDPIVILKEIMHKDFINIHGPEHHFLDGASFMMALFNSGYKFDLDAALNELSNRSVKMPGAMCGYWGVCGSVASSGAVFAILDSTGPLSDDEFYKKHMGFTAKIINQMSEIGGPRCCKRNAFLSISQAIKYANENYNVHMELENITCEFSCLNKQCIKNRCPFYKAQ